MAAGTAWRRKQAGFNLMQVLVTVTIVGITASIAIPNYSNYQRRAHRQTGTACMMNVQSLMESYYQRKNAYPGSLSTLGLATSSNCPDSKYTVTLSADVVGTCEKPQCYELRATAPGAQTRDGTLVLQVRYTSDNNSRFTKQRILPAGTTISSWTD